VRFFPSRKESAADVSLGSPVFQRDAPTTKAALAEYGRSEVARKLLRYAIWRTQDGDKAKDLVADALYRTCDPDRSPWDPSKCSFFKHMRRVMDDVAIQWSRRGFGHYETVDSEHEAFDRVVQPTPQPDLALHAKEKLAWMQGMMRDVLARLGDKDRIVVALWELVCEGRHDEPLELAEELRVPIGEIYEAMRRLRYHGARVRAEWEAQEARRMAALRDEAERARKKGRP
jgi:DNA-directed RNA polymerase specialized sigma24 family protein